MDYKSMQNLLDKYFEGEASLQEERELRSYFNQPNVHPSLRLYQPLFQFLKEEQSRKLDPDFDTRLLKLLQIEEKPVAKVISLRVWMARAAAVLLIAASVWWASENLLNKTQLPVAETKNIDWSKYEPKTPEEAYRVLHASLKKVSVEFKDGAETAAQNVHKVKAINEVLN